MSDLAAVALALAVWLGALVAVPAPRWAAVAVIVIAFAVRRPAVLVVGGALLAASLGAGAWSGLGVPPTSRVRADALLVSDPTEVGHALRVDLRVGGRRVEAWARGDPAARLRTRLAGEVVQVTGRLRAPPPPARRRLAVRHVAARMDVEEVGSFRPGSLAARGANGLRRVLVRGAAPLPPDRRALLSGFLIGDDRAIPPAVEADFRAAGLTHLLAVSGQNLAFVLAVVAPALRRLRLRGRLIGSLAVIAFFAVVTRAEPSVLRASAMAAISCWAAFAGRPVSRLRILALAVAALVLVDPMLVRSVGFQLSVGASIGLVLLAAPVAARLPGPRWLAEALGVTLAAQAGVAPVLLTTFDGMPAITVVANLLAVPVAGPLTAWGLTAGFVAGLAGGPVASLLHAPTGLMVGWIAAVARVAARAPVGAIGGREVAALAVVGIVVLAAHRSPRVPRTAAVVVLGVVPLLAVLVVARPPSGPIDGAEVARGARLWRAGGGAVLVIESGADGARLLAALRREGVGRLDLVVATRGARTIGGVLVDLRSRVGVGAIAAPAGHRIRGATAIAAPTTVTVGRLAVSLRPAGSSLAVTIGETAGRGGRPR